MQKKKFQTRFIRENLYEYASSIDVILESPLYHDAPSALNYLFGPDWKEVWYEAFKKDGHRDLRPSEKFPVHVSCDGVEFVTINNYPSGERKRWSYLVDYAFIEEKNKGAFTHTFSIKKDNYDHMVELIGRCIVGELGIIEDLYDLIGDDEGMQAYCSDKKDEYDEKMRNWLKTIKFNELD